MRLSAMICRNSDTSPPHSERRLSRGLRRCTIATTPVRWSYFRGLIWIMSGIRHPLPSPTKEPVILDLPPQADELTRRRFEQYKRNVPEQNRIPRGTERIIELLMNEQRGRIERNLPTTPWKSSNS